MAIEFSISMMDRPGALATLTEALAQNGVNITAIHAAPCTETGLIQFMTSNTDGTIAALRDAGIDYTTNEVLMVPLNNQPGILAKLARGLASRGININAIYISVSGQFVLDVSDVHAAQKVILELNFAPGGEIV